MRLGIRDIDSLAVTPADLSNLWFEGSPDAVEVRVGDGGFKVFPTQVATLDAQTGPTPVDRFYDLADLMEPPCEATVRWPGGTAWLHAVAYHYCSIDEVLDFGDEKRMSPRKLGHGESDAFWARNLAEAVADRICGRTFRAVRKTDAPSGARGAAIQLAWPASRMVTPGWSLVGDGMARRTGPCPADGRLEYIAGRDGDLGADVRWAVAKLAASYLTVTKVPDRAVYESTEAGMTRYTLADEGSTGIPDVDAVLLRHARSRQVVL